MILRPLFHRRFLQPVVLASGVIVLLMLSATMLRAQATTTQEYALVYVVGVDTIGVERMQHSDSAIVGDLRMRGQPRIRWTQQVKEPSGVYTLHVDAWRPGAAESDAPLQRLVLQTRGDSAYVYQAPAPGAAMSAPQVVLPVRAGAAWMMNQSLAHGAWAARRASIIGDTLWVVMAAGATVQSATTVQRGDTVALTIAGLVSEYVFDRDQQLTGLRVPAQGVRGVVVRGDAARTLSASAAPPTPPVSYDAPANAPYIAEAVRVPTPMGHTLVGTLTKPRAAGGKLPVVVTISGSGPQERDVALPGVEGYRFFRQIADTLGRRGIAVLRLDDRGVGESGGTFATATSRDFADDTRAAVAWLRTRDDIDGTRIALVGHSEGGLVAPMVAANDSSLAAIALLAGPAYTGARIIAFQQRWAIDNLLSSSAASMRDSMFNDAQRQLDSTARTNPWMREFLINDPLPTARRVRVPVLVLQGETDVQITPEQADTLAVALRGGGNTDVTVRRLPNTNHLFQRDSVGAPAGYGKLPDRRATSESLGILADWLAVKLRAR